MPSRTQPQLEPGRVYRTSDLAAWSKNAPRLAKRLVRKGELVPIKRGLFAHPKHSRFGVVPPSDEELLRGFFGDSPFLLTGPDRWNALGLGTTAVFATPLVYNKERSGPLNLGGRRFELRRVAFPENPSREWFVVDLLKHVDQAGASREDLAAALACAVAHAAFDPQKLREMALLYSPKAIQVLTESALNAAALKGQ